MRKIYYFIAIAACIFTLTSFSGGFGGGSDATGSPLTSNALCSSCHSGGPYNTQGFVQLLNEDGEAQTSYLPGQHYRLAIGYTSSVAAAAMGFQATILTAQNTGAGTIAGPPPGTRISTFRGATYVDHLRRITDSVVVFDWTAPSTGTGDITVYAGINAVNSNGGTSGDDADHIAVTFTEGTPPPSYTPSTLAALREVDAEGIPTRLAELVEVEGIVYGFDTETDMSNFNILDSTGSSGLAILNFSDSLNYTANEGDRLRLRGSVRQVVGLTYLEVEEATVLSTQHDIADPVLVNALSELVEGRFVQMDSLQMLSPNEWQAAPTNTYDVRFRLPDGDTLLVQIAEGMPVWRDQRPGDGERLYSIQGVVRQYDTDLPYLSGYYLLPRYSSDFEEAQISASKAISAHDLSIKRIENQLEITCSQYIQSVAILSTDGRRLQDVRVPFESTFVKTRVNLPSAASFVVWVRLNDGRQKAMLIGGLN